MKVTQLDSHEMQIIIGALCEVTHSMKASVKDLVSKSAMYEEMTEQEREEFDTDFAENAKPQKDENGHTFVSCAPHPKSYRAMADRIQSSVDTYETIIRKIQNSEESENA